jgi:hypothetical protein
MIFWCNPVTIMVLLIMRCVVADDGRRKANNTENRGDFLVGISRRILRVSYIFEYPGYLAWFIKSSV